MRRNQNKTTNPPYCLFVVVFMVREAEDVKIQQLNLRNTIGNTAGEKSKWQGRDLEEESTF